MNTSLSNHLNVIRPYIKDELISKDSFNKIFSFSKNFLPFYKSGFECRLSKEDSRVDFLVGIPPGYISLPENLQDQIFWPSFRAFCDDWEESNSLMFEFIDTLGLEFDFLSCGEQGEVLPCLFMAIKNDRPLDLSFFTDSIDRWPLSGILDGDRNQIIKTITKCFHYLPQGAFIAHIGAMLSRPTNMMRMVIKSIDPAQIPKYLESVLYPFDFGALHNFINDINPFVNYISLAIDIGESVSPIIGLECRITQGISDNRWKNFVDYLLNLGLCSLEKSIALLEWPGITQKSDCPTSWPKELDFGDLLCGNDAFSIFYRDIYHIKIIYHQDHPVSAKAYLEFSHRWLSKNILNRTGTVYSNSANTLAPDIDEACLPKDIYLSQVSNYYNYWNSKILASIGTTYQAGLLKGRRKKAIHAHVNETNLFIAKRIKIQAGQKILDAGCGTCGPSICIAQNHPNVYIDAITISSKQAKSASRLIQEKNLEKQIQIQVGDFHELPYNNSTYDIVFFLESAGYSYNKKQLLSEVWRVLKPGGSFYIKDAFVKNKHLSLQEEIELEEFNRVYIYKTVRMSDVVKIADEIGFTNIYHQDLSSILSADRVQEVMFKNKGNSRHLTDFGQHHYRFTQFLPIIFGEVKATKPE